MLRILEIRNVDDGAHAFVIWWKAADEYYAIALTKTEFTRNLSLAFRFLTYGDAQHTLLELELARHGHWELV